MRRVFTRLRLSRWYAAGVWLSLVAGCAESPGHSAHIDLDASDDRSLPMTDGAIPRPDGTSPIADATEADSTDDVPDAPMLPDGAVQPLSLCPLDIPQAGDACSYGGLECEYGDDPDMRCNIVMACAAGVWVNGCPAKVSPVEVCCVGNGPACPQDLSGVAQGTACGSDYFACSYTNFRCFCDCVRDETTQTCETADGGAAANVWQCDTPSKPGCPAVRPRLGSPCSEIEDCPYEGNPLGSDGNDVACYFGYWMDSGGTCENDGM